MNENNNAPPPDPPEDITLIVLDDAYESAFLGPDMSVHHLPRAVYSLPLLIEIERERLSIPTAEGDERAMESIGAMVGTITYEHGDKAPIFVDDAMSRETALAEATSIIRPRGFGGRN